MSSKVPKLILHFDVNKTLIMMDKAANKPIDVICNQNIMQNIYGRVLGTPKCDRTKKEEIGKINEQLKNFELEYIHELIETEDKKDFQLKREDRVSFERFVSEHMFPLYKHEKGGKKLSDDKIKEYNAQAKERRVEMMKMFLDLSIGKRFRNFREKLLKEMLSVEPYSIIPAFYELMNYLREKKWDFSVVFRTFGNDIEVCIEEFNEFCDGKYTKYGDGKWMSQKRIDVENKRRLGHFYRTDQKDTLILGTVGEEDIIELTEKNSIGKIDSAKGIHDYFVKETSDGSTISMRDHYHYWNMNGEFNRFGKVLVVDTNEREVLQMFFDDNMLFCGNEKGIVDLMNVEGEHLDVVKFHGLYLHTVNPLRAIMNRKYFIGRVEKSLKMFGVEV